MADSQPGVASAGVKLIVPLLMLPETVASRKLPLPRKLTEDDGVVELVFHAQFRDVAEARPVEVHIQMMVVPFWSLLAGTVADA